MNRLVVGVLCIALHGVGRAADQTVSTSSSADTAVAAPLAQTRPLARSQQTGAPTDTSAAQTTLVRQYCIGCHNDTGKRGGLTLATFDVARADEHAAVAEKVIKKLRAGMMPPPGARRPDEAAIGSLVAALETRLDQAAAARPNPGWRPFQRLTRAEYARAVRDLFGIEVDVNAFLPADVVSSHGFDNSSDDQSFSPTLMEGYLRAADAITRLAIGDKKAAPSQTTYTVPITASQMRHVEGAPLGTRGGISLVHIFPADGEYTVQLLLYGGPNGEFYGQQALFGREQIEVSLNGRRVALLEVNPGKEQSDPDGLGGLLPFTMRADAGPQRVSAAFIRTGDGPIDDLIAPIEYLFGDANAGVAVTGITAPAHLRSLTLSGPHNASGVSDTLSRQRIFTCRPARPSEEPACAAQIIRRLATQAYRGPVGAEDLADLMRFYERGRKTGDFEAGIQWTLQAMLANPRFVFRLERVPPSLRAGQTYRIGDEALASRLSFFLWGTIPDNELIKVAAAGGLKTPAALEQQVRRMLADPRSEALATRFAAQWLRLKQLEQFRPDYILFPHWDQTLVESLRRETELFFDSLVREDRPVLDLITADYTFVNERVAKHYGIPNVMGHDFRRVSLLDANRRGILGHGSVLMLTSIADRTSPVVRGKWVMEVLLGTPPPPPPPNVPDLEETKGVQGTKVLSVRERLEAHRANPSCNSCHRVIDPLGLALENFDAVGAWRIKDGDVSVDASGELYDGTKVDGPASLRAALLKHQDVLIGSFTEHLMTYALGRAVEHYDMPAIRGIVRDAARNDNRMSSFILGVVKSAPFQMSRAPDAPTTDASASASVQGNLKLPRR